MSSESRELAFKQAVVRVADSGMHPSAPRILTEMGRSPEHNSVALNGEQARWRREVLTELGWTKKPGLAQQWKRP